MAIPRSACYSTPNMIPPHRNKQTFILQGLSAPRRWVLYCTVLLDSSSAGSTVVQYACLRIMTEPQAAWHLQTLLFQASELVSSCQRSRLLSKIVLLPGMFDGHAIQYGIFHICAIGSDHSQPFHSAKIKTIFSSCDRPRW